MKKTNNLVSFDWRIKYLEAGYEKAAKSQKKGNPPIKEDYLGWTRTFWNDFIREALTHFYEGLQWIMVPWPPDDEDGLATWEDECFDPHGLPTSFYDEAFADSFCELATQYGEFSDAATAKLYLSLADRYAKRGEWVLSVMRAMFFELPDLPAAMVNAYYEIRCDMPPGYKPAAYVESGAGLLSPQLPLFGLEG